MTQGSRTPIHQSYVWFNICKFLSKLSIYGLRLGQNKCMDKCINNMFWYHTECYIPDVLEIQLCLNLLAGHSIIKMHYKWKFHTPPYWANHGIGFPNVYRQAMISRLKPLQFLSWWKYVHLYALWETYYIVWKWLRSWDNTAARDIT